MGRRTNLKFLKIYLTLDKVLCDRHISGVSEYISRLDDARYAERREEVLKHLLRYRSIRNRLAHEPGALDSIKSISSGDIKWIKRFLRDLRRGRDPVSRYIHRAERLLIIKKIKAYATVALIASAAIAIIALIINLS